MKNLAKLTFSLALAAVFVLGYLTVGSEPIEATVACPAIMCSGIHTITSTSCNYFEESTGCTFRCHEGIMGFGPSSVTCTTDCLWDFPF